jgi:hypothetical protein
MAKWKAFTILGTTLLGVLLIGWLIYVVSRSVNQSHNNHEREVRACVAAGNSWIANNCYTAIYRSVEPS